MQQTAWISKWGGRLAFPALIIAFFLMPGVVHAQTTDPTTIWTAILTFITGPAGKILASLAIVAVGIACFVGHHPIAGMATIVGGLALVFSAQYFVQTFVGG